jgi:hypothetical protein
MADWFEKNAPQGGGWFQQNSPSANRPAGLPEGIDMPSVSAHPPVTLKGDEPGILDTVGKRITGNASGLVRPFIHPRTVLSEAGWVDPSKSTDLISDIRDNPNSTGIGNAVGDALTAAALGGVAKVAPELPGRIGTGLKRAGAGINNVINGTTADAMANGANPGRALSENRIIGSNAATLSERLNRRIPAAKAEEMAVYASNPNNAVVNVGPAINEPFDSLIQDKTNPKTGAAEPSQVARARRTQSVLNTVQDPVTGRPTTSLRNPFLSPLEAVELKSNIYGMTDYDNPSQAALSNISLKGAAHNLKNLAVDAVPEAAPYTQRLHDMMEAKDLLEPKSKFVKLPTDKEGLIKRGITLGGTTAAAGADLLGSGIGKLNGVGRYLQPPLAASVLFPKPERR